MNMILSIVEIIGDAFAAFGYSMDVDLSPYCN
jgi:hypothetical protein